MERVRFIPFSNYMPCRIFSCQAFVVVFFTAKKKRRKKIVDLLERIEIS
jgi:hypothetical protein